jgi:hemoglobin-like flavoprotein
MSNHPVSAADAARIRASFSSAAQDPGALAAAFYRRLFAAEPGLRSLFPTDMTGQEHKLAAMLAAAVAGIRNGAALTPVVEGLGRRHQALGVRPEHYPPVGAALLAALEDRAGAPLDAATQAAWGRAFAWLTAVMTRPEAPAAPEHTHGAPDRHLPSAAQ